MTDEERELRTHELVYTGACLIAGMRLAREKQIHPRVVATSEAIDQSIELAWEIHHRLEQRIPENMDEAEELTRQTNVNYIK